MGIVKTCSSVLIYQKVINKVCPVGWNAFGMRGDVWLASTCLSQGSCYPGTSWNVLENEMCPEMSWNMSNTLECSEIFSTNHVSAVIFVDFWGAWSSFWLGANNKMCSELCQSWSLFVVLRSAQWVAILHDRVTEIAKVTVGFWRALAVILGCKMSWENGVCPGIWK